MRIPAAVIFVGIGIAALCITLGVWAIGYRTSLSSTDFVVDSVRDANVEGVVSQTSAVLERYFSIMTARRARMDIMPDLYIQQQDPRPMFRDYLRLCSQYSSLSGGVSLNSTVFSVFIVCPLAGASSMVVSIISGTKRWYYNANLTTLDVIPPDASTTCASDPFLLEQTDENRNCGAFQVLTNWALFPNPNLEVYDPLGQPELWASPVQPLRSFNTIGVLMSVRMVDGPGTNWTSIESGILSAHELREMLRGLSIPGDVILVDSEGVLVGTRMERNVSETDVVSMWDVNDKFVSDLARIVALPPLESTTRESRKRSRRAVGMYDWLMGPLEGKTSFDPRDYEEDDADEGASAPADARPDTMRARAPDAQALRAAPPGFGVEGGARWLGTKFTATIDGELYVIDVVRLPSVAAGLDWYGVVAVPESYYYDRVRSGTFTALGVSLGLTGILLVCLIFLAVVIVAPLRDVSRALSAMATMDARNLHEALSKTRGGVRCTRSAAVAHHAEDDHIPADDDDEEILSAGVDARSNAMLALAKHFRRHESTVGEMALLQESFSRLATTTLSLSKYVPEELARKYAQGTEVAELGMSGAVPVLLFSDIERFTNLCEQKPIRVVMPVIAQYLAAMTDLVHLSRGMVDKFIGDAVMAIWDWNSSVRSKDHQDVTLGAVVCAINMLGLVHLLRQRWLNIRIRIGMHCGNALVGNIGSASRYNYTVVGDVVNTASRLEGACKDFGTYMCVSSAMVDRDKRVQESLPLRYVGQMVVKGRTHPTRCYDVVKASELLSRANNPDSRLSGLCSPFDAAGNAMPGMGGLSEALRFHNKKDRAQQAERTFSAHIIHIRGRRSSDGSNPEATRGQRSRESTKRDRTNNSGTRSSAQDEPELLKGDGARRFGFLTPASVLDDQHAIRTLLEDNEAEAAASFTEAVTSLAAGNIAAAAAAVDAVPWGESDKAWQNLKERVEQAKISPETAAMVTARPTKQ
eukprot:TRINITY_DN1773_c0_g1_i1.p1 TRINITY_DN1773_c0_g1~~TRINITY_DN1773_c0_g1_i1.p1  ORF type:complete len:979 (+),score=183.87 TRINITY_DN1773_c0_g1_i1:182-3118(+)